MAMIWKVIAVSPETAETEGTKGWEPFSAYTDLEGETFVLCKGLVEVETEKSSAYEGE